VSRTRKPDFVSCRIYGVLLRRARVLLTRSRFGRREFVNFPGGGIELGESPIRALHREFKEETGLAIRPRRVLYASERLHLSTVMPMQIVSIYWLVEERSGKLKLGGNNEDVLNLFWADAGRIPTGEMFPSDREFTRRLPGLLAHRP
jgi:8-oxo-dGTP pyrophosphatase MutT (NUDIX family)